MLLSFCINHNIGELCLNIKAQQKQSQASKVRDRQSFTIVVLYEHRRAGRWTTLNYASHYLFSRSKARSQQQAPSHTTKITNQVSLASDVSEIMTYFQNFRNCGNCILYEHRRAERWTALNYTSHYPFSRSRARSQQLAQIHVTKIPNQV